MPAKTSTLKGIALALLSGVCYFSEARADDAFALGLQAFKAENYQAALEQFNAALTQGQDTPLLHYNLGSTYYKLADYESARRHFLLATGAPKLSAVANYNLGLISLRSNQLDEAKEYFAKVLQQTDDGSLKKLAQRQLDKLSGNAVTKTPEPSSWQDRFTSYLSFTYNYDDNITNTNEDLLPDALQGDSFIDLYGTVSYELPTSSTSAYIVKAGLYASRYRDYRDYDQDQLNLGFYRDTRLGRWQTRSGLHVYRDTLGSTGFQQRYNLQLRGDLPYSTTQRLRLQYDFTDFHELDDLYTPLSGQRHRFRLENRSRLSSTHLLRLGYRYEFNQREDYASATSFTSYSPERNTGYIALQSKLTNKVDSHLEFEYRSSIYQDANIDNSVNLGIRDDTRAQTTLRVDYQLTEAFEIEAAYRYTNNDSNYSTKSYKSNLLSLGINVQF